MRVESIRRIVRALLRSSAVLCLVASVVGCGTDGSGGRRPPPPYDIADPELPARLDAALRTWAGEYGLVGASAQVTTPGWFHWQGTTGSTDLRGSGPVPVDMQARVGSATKPMTATLILQLVDEGRLSLDTRLSDFLPDYPNADAITVEMLLQHRSGIRELQVDDTLFVVAVFLQPGRWFTPEDVLAWTVAPFPLVELSTFQPEPRGPVGPPGGPFHYAQPGYSALGLIAERVTGRALADLYEERIFEPLGMDGTRFPRPGEAFEPAGFTSLFGLLPTLVPIRAVAPSPDGLASSSGSAGGMISNAADLQVFLQAFLEARLFPERLRDRATSFLPTGRVEDGEEEGYGLGLYRLVRDGVVAWGHSGTVPSGSSEMVYLPELDVYVTAVSNTDRDADLGPLELQTRVRAALLGEPQPAARVWRERAGNG